MRHLLVSGVICLAAALFLDLSASGQVTWIPHTNVHWAPLSWKDDTLIAADGHILPLPIIFPHQLRPLGNVALVLPTQTDSSRPQVTRSLYEVFFDSSQENQTLEWARHASNIKLSPVVYEIIESQDRSVKTFNNGKIWRCLLYAKVHTQVVRLMWVGEQAYKPNDLASTSLLNNEDKAYRKILNVMFSSNSPLKQQQRFITLTITYPVPAQ